MSSRRRPLHTCGVAVLSIAEIAYTRSRDFNGPLGSMIRETSRLVEFTSPLICALQYQWLAMLSFADDLILAMENIVETIFPALNHVFNAIDKLVQITEILPGKLDDAVREFPMIIHQYSLLDWAVMQVVSWMNFWICILIQWGLGHAMEKEIMMDSNSTECNTESSSGNQPAEPSAQVGIVNNESGLETNAVNTTFKTDVTKSPCKEELKKGKREENTKNESVGAMEETEREAVSDEEGRKRGDLSANRSDESIMTSDPILELFESGWLMTPRKEPKEGWLLHSVSYTS